MVVVLLEGPHGSRPSLLSRRCHRETSAFSWLCGGVDIAFGILSMKDQFHCILWIKEYAIYGKCASGKHKQLNSGLD